MNHSDLSRTTRIAFLDDDGDDATRAQFGADLIREARERGHDTIIWHFATRDSLDHITPTGTLGQIVRTLKQTGESEAGGVGILLSARPQQRLPASGPRRRWRRSGRATKPWLGLDDTAPHRDARADQRVVAGADPGWPPPGWTSATDFDHPTREPVKPIVIFEELQQVVAQRSGLMTLPTNGIFDSYCPEFLGAVRPDISEGRPELSVAVAALGRDGGRRRSVP